VDISDFALVGEPITIRVAAAERTQYGSRTWCCELGEGARVVDVILLRDGRL
jgi:hypothetical protein